LNKTPPGRNHQTRNYHAQWGGGGVSRKVKRVTLSMGGGESKSRETAIRDRGFNDEKEHITLRSKQNTIRGTGKKLQIKI